ncbi:FBD-associated F-box protein At4g10400 [Brachypodium distachyon]|uniref:F-box domain-containing protein n=1 Tax=Brachypodium distachyon TaxID=15368 RepID=I1HRM1_BRADI|nr:FBD-associated F-box protein At4g10400 [Brachypodium distachyon]KQK09751.1 hypothetical protein BRADI_2g50000v3 [Brachypodium distachyon]|eukprot:XP_003567121.1 FBD-associated F-box protein At4g10400 [Brachypodium distachyon]
MGRSPTAPAYSKRKRRRRRTAGDGEGAALLDCFSNLPDDVLLAITSRLPTRQAVSLSALARRFRHLPTLFPRVESVSISDPPFPIPMRNTPPVILRRLDVTPTRRLVPAALRRFIEAAADNGVSELAVRLRRRACLPRDIFSISSLTVLSLDTCAVPRASAVACPRLLTLKLYSLFISQETITALLSVATGLERLEIVFCTGLVGGCTVESSTVRSFLFRPALEQRDVTLRTAGLRTITLYTRPRTQRVRLAPAPEVRKAYLHVSNSSILTFRMRPFLDAGTSLASLTLRGVAMTLLSAEYKDTLKLPITFQDLTILSVRLDFSCESEVLFLLKLLESCPSLQQLTVSDAEKHKEETSLSFADHKERLAKVSCLADSLVQFNFVGFKAGDYQKELLVFLLNRATKLKKVGVRFPNSEDDAVRWALSVRKAPIERKSTKFNLCHLELEYP